MCQVGHETAHSLTALYKFVNTGALESATVLWHLRNCRYIIIIIHL